MRTFILLWIALSGVSPASGGSLAELRRQVAEQERQIRQLEIENERLRYMLTEEIDYRGDPLYGTTVSGNSPQIAVREPSEAPSNAAGPESRTAKSNRTDEIPKSLASRGSAPEKPRFHSIRAGENLYRISLRYGVDLNELFAANPGIDAHRLRVGQKVRIPGAGPMLAQND